MQSFHFGGRRKQTTVHTCVAYKAAGSQSCATNSAALWHDERAVWAHLEPVLRDVMRNGNPSPTTLHITSISTLIKIFFYLLTTIPFLSGFKQVTWNFSEKSHGKGAPMELVVQLSTLLTLLSKWEQMSSPQKIFTAL